MVGSALASQSVFETQSEYFSPSDLLKFQNLYNITRQTAIVENGYAATSCGFTTCGEGNLDIQYIMGVSQHTTSTYWYVTNTTETDPFLLYLIQLADKLKPPLVNSISWGGIEQVRIF